MKNINLLPTQTMFKGIHYIFGEIYRKAIYLDTTVQETVEFFQKEVDGDMLKLREDVVEDSIIIEIRKIAEEKEKTSVKLMEDIIKTKKTIKYLRHDIDHAKLSIDYYFKTPKHYLITQFFILYKKSDILLKTDDGHRMKQDEKKSIDHLFYAHYEQVAQKSDYGLEKTLTEMI